MSKRRGRFIHSRASCRQIPDLLQLIFAGEVLSPSRCIWIVSPWISDIVVIDNRTNRFSYLEPDWSRREVRFSEVIMKILNLGTLVRVATKPVGHNESFVEKMRVLERKNLPVAVFEKNELHEKGILGNDYYLSGSMNFTFSGISVNEESVHYHTNPEIVAENRIILANRWGAER